MATDYFTMMRDAVGSYGEGLDLARARAKSDAEEARKATLFGQEQEQYERKRGIQKGTDDAFGSYKALQGGVYDGSQADFSGVNPEADAGPVQSGAPVTSAGGGALPKRTATRSELIGARKNIAVAAQDYSNLGKLEEEGRSAEWDDTFAKHYKSYSGSAQQIEEAAKHINTNSKSITLHEPDKQGFRQMSVVSPDGTATLLKLGKHDQAQLWAASQMMELDPQKALALMHGIDKSLAAAVAAENGIVDKVGQHQNTMAYNKGQLSEAQQRTAIARAGLGSRSEQVQPVGMSDDGKRILARQGGKLVEMPVPDGYSKLFPRLTGDRPPRPEFTAKDISDVVTELRMDKDNKGLNYEQLRQKAIGVLGGTQSGVLPGWGEAAPGVSKEPAPSAAIKPPPSRAQAAYDNWQASKRGWFQQDTPTSKAVEAAAEQEYLDALRNPPR